MPSTDHTYIINTNSTASRSRDAVYVSILATARTDPRFDHLVKTDTSFNNLILMIDGSVNMDMTMDALFGFFIRPDNPYISTAPVDFTELMICFIHTVATKLPTLLTLRSENSQQFVSLDMNSDSVSHGTKLDLSEEVAVSPHTNDDRPTMDDLKDYSHDEAFPKVIATNVKNPTISDHQKTKSSAEKQNLKNSEQQHTKNHPSGKHTKKHSINLTKFLALPDDQKDLDISYDTDTIVDVQDDVLQVANNDDKDKWVTAVKGRKHVISGSSEQIQNQSVHTSTNPNSLFATFAVNDDIEDDDQGDNVMFTQERRSPSQRSNNADDISRVSSTTSYRHRDINSMTQKEVHEIVNRELKRIRSKGETMMLRHKKSIKDTCEGYLIQLKETYSDLIDECEHDYLERKNEISNQMEMEKDKLHKDITEMRFQRTSLHQFQKLLEGTTTNIESDFIKRIEDKLKASVTTILDDEQDKNSGYRESFNQDIDQLRCDFYDLQKTIPSDDSTLDKINNLVIADEANRKEIDRLSTISGTLLDRLTALEKETKDNTTNNSSNGHLDNTMKEQPKKRLFQNVNLDNIDGHCDDQPGQPYGLKPLLPYPEESRVCHKFLNGSQQGQECYILSSADREDGTRWYSAMTNNNTVVSFPESRRVTEVIKVPQTARATASIQHYVSSAHQSPSVGSPANSYGPRSPHRPAPYLQQGVDRNNFGREYRLHDDEFTCYVGGTGTVKVTKRVKETQLTSFDKAPERIVVLNTRNGKEFYNSLRLVISPYNIPLVDWSQITDAKQILDLDPLNTGNYESARQVMARALYCFFDRHKEEIFDHTTHFGDALVSYEKSLDGISFLSDIVALRHPYIVKSACHSNTTIETLTMPTYSLDIGLFNFINDCERYFESNPGKTLLFQTLFVKESLEKDKRRFTSWLNFTLYCIVWYIYCTVW